jgi:hypothetical protein
MASAREALTETQWDALLDGEPHEVELLNLRFAGGFSAFRSAVYREAEVRYGWARTKRISGTVIQVQGVDCRPDFARRHKASPKPFYAMPERPTSTPQEQPPTMTVEPEAEELSAADMEALLGPCTCGQSPICTPSCARFS